MASSQSSLAGSSRDTSPEDMTDYEGHHNGGGGSLQRDLEAGVLPGAGNEVVDADDTDVGPASAKKPSSKKHKGTKPKSGKR